MLSVKLYIFILQFFFVQLLLFYVAVTGRRLFLCHLLPCQLLLFLHGNCQKRWPVMLTRYQIWVPDTCQFPPKKQKKKPKPPFPFTSCRLAVFPTDKKIYAYILYAYISMQWACAWDSGVGQKVAENSSSCYWLPVEYLYIFRLNRTEINRRVMEYNCKDNSSDINLCLWLLRS